MSMKVGTLNIPSQTMAHGRDAERHVEKTENNFLSDLSKHQGKQSLDWLKQMFAKIDESGKRLSSTPTYGELKHYTNLIKNFVSESVANMYSLESRSAWDRQGRKKVFSLVKKIDDTLAQITEDVRIGQDRQLSIMEKHGLIRGMLVDLVT